MAYQKRGYSHKVPIEGEHSYNSYVRSVLAGFWSHTGGWPDGSEEFFYSRGRSLAIPKPAFLSLTLAQPRLKSPNSLRHRRKDKYGMDVFIVTEKSN